MVILLCINVNLKWFSFWLRLCKRLEIRLLHTEGGLNPSRISCVLLVLLLRFSVFCYKRKSIFVSQISVVVCMCLSCFGSFDAQYLSIGLGLVFVGSVAFIVIIQVK